MNGVTEFQLRSYSRANVHVCVCVCVRVTHLDRLDVCKYLNE